MAKTPALKAESKITEDQSVPKSEKKNVSQKQFPAYSIDKSLLIAKAIVDHYGGESADPTLIAISIGWAPTGGSWRALCGASVAYGFTEGGYNATEIRLTQRGKAVVRPAEAKAIRPALFEALLTPAIMKAFVTKYNRQKYPAKEFAINVLQTLGLPRDRCAVAFELITENLNYLDALKKTSNGQIVLLDPSQPVSATPVLDLVLTEDDLSFDEPDYNAPPLSQSMTTHPSQPKTGIFIAHGKDQIAVDQLKRLLDQIGVKSVLAQNEAHAGRPISQKVADLMRECSAGIFVASADDDATDSHGKAVKRARQNVIYELGAASFAYGQRIIIFKERGVEFPSDFSDLGYIEYERGQLSNKFPELIAELVKLKVGRFEVNG